MSNSNCQKMKTKIENVSESNKRKINSCLAHFVGYVTEAEHLEYEQNDIRKSDNLYQLRKHQNLSKQTIETFKTEII